MADNRIDLNDVVTAPEAAAMAKISKQAVKDAIKHKWIDSRKAGGVHLLRRSDVERYWKHRIEKS